MKKLIEAEKIINSVCADHCLNTCVLKYHVKDGVITRIETDNGEEPQYRACLRGRAYRRYIYDPNRLKYPMRRTGERGEGKFERISWDEALETIAAQLKRVKETYGAHANILLCSLGDYGYLHNGGLIDRLLVKLGGYTGVYGTLSNEATVFASRIIYGGGEPTTSSRESLFSSRLIVLWGWNPVVTRQYGKMPYFMSQLREAGIRIVSVDPKYCETAALIADQWIPIRPGTDAAMLVAMAYVIIAENLQDTAFLDKYTVGFNEFKRYVLGDEDGIPKTPSWAETITDVPAATIVSLAREYATAKPAAIMDGWAPARTAYGEQFNRLLATLSAMTGNLGIRGGSAGVGSTGGPVPPFDPGKFVSLHMTGGRNPVDLAAPLRKDSLEYWKRRRERSAPTRARGHYYFGGPSAAYLCRVRVADAILRGREGGYPSDYKLLYMVTVNYVNQYPDTNKIIQALKKLEFVVVQEQFMTANAKFADILLPQCTVAERNDLTIGNLDPFYGYMKKVIDPLGESRSQFEIATGLAAKLGIADLDYRSEEEWLREVVKGWKAIKDYDTFKDQGICKMEVPKHYIAFERHINDPEHNPFLTPSRKIEIYSQTLADMGNPNLPPVPKYIETWESLNDPLAKNYPLQLITTHFLRRTHSKFDTNPWLRELEAQAVWINSEDASSRGVQDGDMVRVFNDRGQTVLPARVTERIMLGVVDIPEGAWYSPDENGIDRGGCPNVLISDEPSPGGGFCGNTALVQVEKYNMPNSGRKS